MNFNFYIFGNPGGQYNQYPQDYTQDIFSPLCNGVQGARAVIYRQSDLMHYMYIENLGEDKYLGLCLIFNKYQSRHPKNLFGFLKSVIENHCLKSNKLIKYTTDGNIAFTISSFCNDIKTYDYLKSVINSTLESKNNFGLEEVLNKYNGITKTKYLSWEEQNRTILQYLEEGNKVVIEDSAGIEENHIYKVIEALKTEIQIGKEDTGQLLDILDRKDNEIAKLTRQKKQFKLVAILGVGILACAVGLFFLRSNLDDARDAITVLQEDIDALNNTIDSKNNEISNLNQTINDKDNIIESQNTIIRDKDERIDYLQQEKEEINTKLSVLTNIMPIRITQMQFRNVTSSESVITGAGYSIYSNKAQYIQPYITYQGLRSGENITLKLRFYKSDGTVLYTGTNSPAGYSYTSSIYVNSGSGNTVSLSGWGSSGGSWTAGKYRCEIWYGNCCLYQQNFTIY